MNIAVDLDDTLNHYIDHLLTFFEHHLGKKHHLTKQDFLHRHLHQCLGISKKEFDFFFNKFQMDAFMHEMQPHPDAKEVLPKLAQHHDLFIITGRLEPHTWEVEDWLKKHFPGIFKKVLIAKNPYYNSNDHLKTKEEYCKELEISLFIDDDPNFALDVAQEGFQVLMIEQPWNKKTKHKNIVHVKNWHDIA